MKMRLVVVLLAMLTPYAFAYDIAGYWAHSEMPVWIKVSVAEGTGVAVRNDDRPDRVGFRILKDVESGATENVWKAQVFAAKLEEYKNAELRLEEPDVLLMRVKVGFITREVEWNRVDEVPEADSPRAQ